MTDVHVIDYGASNLLSLCRAVEAVGGRAVRITNPADLADAKRLIIPGVGAFGDCARAFERRGWVEPVRAYAAAGGPLLGICVGMQMLFDYSLEFGRHPGLGLIGGHVEQIPDQSGGIRRKVPNVGWSSLLAPRELPADVAAPEPLVVEAVSAGEAAYFVHSYACIPRDSACCTAVIDYFGVEICAAVESGNVMGMQFHPEKSGIVGLRMLDHFLVRPLHGE
jgi:imidazole glycerol-phosphate synthase subunit HisH